MPCPAQHVPAALPRLPAGDGGDGQEADSAEQEARRQKRRALAEIKAGGAATRAGLRRRVTTAGPARRCRPRLAGVFCDCPAPPLPSISH